MLRFIQVEKTNQPLGVDMTLATYEKFSIQTGVEKAWAGLEEIISNLEVLVYDETIDDKTASDIGDVVVQVEDCFSTVRMVLETIMYRQWKVEKSL